MIDKKMIFIAGLHRSGTSLLYKILKEHPDISAFSDTGVPEDEGQHLQNVYKTARYYGGPGKFALHPEAYMDENHPLASKENAHKLYNEWIAYLDPAKEYLLEKSPPNLIRMRFLRRLFPKSYFIVILRDPIAVTLATKNKWKDSGTINELFEHYIQAYNICYQDMQDLDNVHLLHYEDLTASPQKSINEIFQFLKLKPTDIKEKIQNNINQKYYEQWREEMKKMNKKEREDFICMWNEKMKKFNYSLPLL